MKYSLKLINDYINGDDLHGYSTEVLENDPEFMKQVIVACNDKNMYRMCSDHVKGDYDFVMFMIDKFSYDPYFIDEVATTFLNLNSDDLERVGVVVKMCKKLEELNIKELYANYKLVFIAHFVYDMASIELYKEENPDYESEIGLGFVLLFDRYNYDMDVLKYCAKQLIEYLFTDYGVNLENEIHKDFRTPNDIYHSGLMNYMITFLGRYDPMLSDFAINHNDVLDGFQERINKIQVRWNNYTDTEEEQKYEEMFDRVHEYMEDHEMETIVGEYGYLHYIGKELGISAKLARYSGLDRETYEMLNTEETDMDIEVLLQDLKERIIYSNIKRIMLETLFGEYEEKRHEGKIIEVDFTKLRK